MAIDIYHTRRDKFKRCIYYGRCPENLTLDSYVNCAKPLGIFYASEISDRSLQGQDIESTFYVNREIVTLATHDEVFDLTEGNVVVYLGDIWTVDTITRELHHKETQFSDKLHATTYLSIRK